MDCVGCLLNVSIVALLNNTIMEQHLNNSQGLTSSEAKNRLLHYGPNIIEEKRPNRLTLFAKKFWSPIPWMLEVTILLQLTLRKYDEAIIITVLLLFNSVLSFFQEERANKALALLRHHLAIKARVLRDSKWQLIAAKELVPNDIVHLRSGDILPADIKILDGNILIDQSALTGEAMPVEGEVGKIAYSGAIINRGEATGEVVATGRHTYFGKSVELIQTAKTESHTKTIIFTIIKYLVTIDLLLALFLFIFALITYMPIIDFLPYILVLIIASIPVALPATFTLTTALGATQLAKRGILVTHLTAIEEAATMDVVCLDKTGTITQNQLKVEQIKSFNSYTDVELLYYAALASDASNQDPIDEAILSAANDHNLLSSIPERMSFTPFDPAIKHTEAIFQKDDKQLLVIKGTPDIIASMVCSMPNITTDIARMAETGCRVLAVAVNKNYEDKTENQLELVGLIALHDPPRVDSKSLLHRLKQYGLRILLVTGDNQATATAVAACVGLNTNVAPSQILQSNISAETLNYDIYAGMFPADKFRLVKALQDSNHIVGMTGDGINDAPALKQAEVGIAVENATDVAKAAASIILTQPGLSGILAAIKVSRRIYQRMLTYILNKVIKSFEIAVFLTIGVFLTGNMIVTPLLIVLLLFTNDFVTMSIATDNVSFSYKPQRWQILHVMITGCLLSILILLLSFSIFFYARDILHLSLPELQTLMFVMLVFTGQGTIYLIRERKHLWSSLPSCWLILSSIFDILIVTMFATQGILMTAISFLLVIKLLFVIISYLFLVDFFKVRIFSYFKLH
ncbi:TPA: plasma-membrane proton-efflux P-type ATPase [Legionella bozemanae]